MLKYFPHVCIYLREFNVKKIYCGEKVFVGAWAVFGFLAAIAYVIMQRPTAWSKTLMTIVREQYSSSINVFWPPGIGGISWPMVFYQFVVLVFIVTLVSSPIFCRRFQQRPPASKLLLVFVSMLILQTVLQSVSLLGFFGGYWGPYIGKSLLQKNEILHGKRYRFAAVVQKVLPGYHRAEFLTDMDMSHDPGMFYHRVLAYHLYPIDIRGIHDAEPDTLVIYNHKNAETLVNPPYRIVEKFDPRHLVAVKP